MPTYFYIVFAIALLSFLLLAYKGIDRLLMLSHRSEIKSAKVNLLEEERQHHLEKINQLFNDYDTLVAEVKELKAREKEQEALQYAMYKSLINKYVLTQHLKSSTGTLYFSNNDEHQSKQIRISGDSIKYKVSPQYQNSN
jgi:hypothetical protein